MIVGEPQIRIVRHAIGENPLPGLVAADLGNHLTHDGVVKPGDDKSVKGNIVEIGFERAVQGFQRLPEIHVLGVDIGDNADAGRQRGKRAIGFIRLDDHPLTLTNPGI